MNKALIALMLILSALPAFAQRYPRFPRPPRSPIACEAVAVDRYNRLIARFYGRMDPRSGMCREALRNCNMEIRRRGWYDARCVQPMRY